MIAVMDESEIDRNPTSAPDLPFFGMESPKEEENMDPIDPEISQSLDLPAKSQDLEEARVRVSPSGGSTRSPAGVSEPNEGPLVDMNGFLIGDMVWGKVKSHPWWPGHLFDESFASSSVRRTKRDDLLLVAFFGDSSYGWFDPAELIPYEPTFVEKSKQTTSRSFVRAVEESLDESSRRAALGLSCRCRNPYNFRPMRVPNFFEVDVVGYERNGIYSKRQINDERDSFDPKDALDFLRQLAVAPKEAVTKDVEWHRNVARAVAVRRVRYEEFDETYAQAFGQQPVRPARDEMGVPEQAERFTPRVAPLSGPLVFAETLGNKKKPVSKHHHSSSSSHREKDRSSKKNKYVLKRRDEHLAVAAAASSPRLLPDAYFAQKQKPPFVLTDSPATNSSSASEYVLQKREPVEDTKPVDRYHRPESPQTPPVPGAALDEIVDEKSAAVQPLKGGAVVKKEKKIKKRSLEDVNNQEEVKMMKKKKKKKHRDGLGKDFPPVFKKTAADAEATGALETPVAYSRPVSPPSVDLGPLDQLELPSVVADLAALALDPFYGIERNAPLIARHVFLRFRSLVYSKSLVIPAPSESDAQGQEVQASKSSIAPTSSHKEEREQQQQRDQDSSSLKPSKSMKRADDPTKAGKKRALSDRQEEITAKRLKKVMKLKSLASEKKAGVNQKSSPDRPNGNNGTVTTTATKSLASEKKAGTNQKSSSPDRPNGNTGTATTTATAATAAAAPSTAESAKKPERKEPQPPLLPVPPKRESPTYLVMRFPPRSTLPSVSNLKARFARFGPLVVDSTRVFWKSHSCRVQFKYKSDALRALSYVKSNDIFGQVQVDYTIKEVEAPAPEPVPEPSNRRSEAQSDGSSLQFRPGNGSGAQPRSAFPQGKLRSILKKPGEEAGKENQRVKFMLSGNSSGSSSSTADSPPSASGSGGGGVSFADVAQLQPPPLKSTAFQLPLPPPQPRQTLPQPSRPHPAQSYEPHLFAAPPLPPRPVESRAPPTVKVSETEGKSRSNVDISHQMLSLLLRCNDIVAGLRALPGFVPYRPL